MGILAIALGSMLRRKLRHMKKAEGLANEEKINETVNYDIINKASKIAINGGPEWDDIGYV